MRPSRDRAVLLAFQLILLGLGYYVLARLCLSVDAVGGFASLIWPAAGVAIAAMWRLGPWAGLPIAAAAFFTSLAVGAPTFAALGIAVGNTLEAFVAVTLLRRLGFDASFCRFRDVIMFGLFVGAIAPLLAATIGVSCLWLAGALSATEVSSAWWAWWRGDMLGAVVVAPALMISFRDRHWNRRQVAELAVALTCIVVSSAIVFFDLIPTPDRRYGHTYVIFPFMVWAVVRFEQRGAIGASVLVAILSVAATVIGHGPFARAVLRHSLEGLQGFLAVYSIVMLLIAAAMSERARALQRVRRAEERSRFLARSGATLASSLDYENVLELIAKLVVPDIADACIVDLFAEDGSLGRGEVHAATAEKKEMVTRLRSLPATGAMKEAFKAVIAAKRAVLLPKMDDASFAAMEPSEAHRHAVREMRPAQVLLVPLFASGAPLGILSLALFDDTNRTFSTDEIDLAEELAGRAALAIDNARLYADAERVRKENALLAKASAGFSESLDYEKTLERVTQLTVPEFADGCAVFLAREEGTPPKLVAHMHADREKHAALHELFAQFPMDTDKNHGAAHVIRTGKPDLLSVLDEESLTHFARSPAHLKLLKEVGAQSYVCLPMIIRGKTIGAIAFLSSSPTRRFGEREVAVASRIARRAAFAFENARLYKEANEAIRMRDDFLAVAGHELRTPLAALLVQVQSFERFLRKQNSPPEHFERVEKIARSAKRLAHLIDELLDVVRITAGRIKLQPASVDLADLAREVAAQLGDEARSKKTEIVCEGQPGLIGNWDKLRIEQVITNLVSNGLKYGAGKPLTIRWRAVDGHAELQVSDEGIGIEPSQQSRIFERFERVQTVRDVSGLGLGLWISKQIIDVSGGKISVESEPGKGAIFTIRLPLS